MEVSPFRMGTPIAAAALDEILALQTSVAWAGEAAGGRLGWWASDLVDPEGGGDLFARLTPKTAAWASLILVREAACRVDEKARASFAASDTMWSLFSFGFGIDEQLSDRLAHHRGTLVPPADVLGPRFIVGKPFSVPSFAGWLREGGAPKITPEPNGLRVAVPGANFAAWSKGSSRDVAVDAARLLAAALLDKDGKPAKKYPFPYIEAGP